MDEAPFLELLNTDERRAEAVREQDKRREKFQHVTTRTPAQANFLFGLSIERQVLHQLESMDDTQAENLRNRLAESYALQARFGDALKMATRAESTVKEYAEKDWAIKNLGNLCGCPEVMVTPSKRDAKGTRSPSRHEIERVSDGERNYKIFRCRLCRTLSAEVS